MLRTLSRIIFNNGYNSSSSKAETTNHLSDGSQNVLVTGTGKNEIFKGVTVKGGVTGARVSMNVGETYGGLGDHSETGIGSIFRVLGAIFFIGAGKLYYSGSYASASASTTLSLKKVTAGVLGTTYQAGLAQPSAPTISAVTPPAGYTGKNGGNVSVKIARVRSATGARSIASLASNVAFASSQSIAVTFPSADANGQDYWEIDVTKNGEGGIGNHYFLQEVAESTVAETVTANATTDADTTIGVPNDTLTSSHIGWTYSSAGDTDTYVTAVGADDSHSAGKQTITLAAASVLSTTQSATFTRAVSGTERTYVIEWADADLAGSDLAPYRDYPPPAGVFGGVVNDCVFVDGCLGDTVSTVDNTANTTISTAGNVIAVSDPAKPESFPPDNYLFTNEAPTAVIEGGEGLYWRFGKNSLGVIQYVGGSPALSYSKIWSGIGVNNQNAVTFGAGGRLYCHTGQRGLVRLGVQGEPDTSFAAPVSDDLAAFTTASVVLGYDANHNYILVGHGTTILAFHEPTETWCAPCDISGALGSKTIKSAVTINGACYISAGDNSSIALYDYNVYSSPVTATFRTAWMRSADVADVISRTLVTLRADNISNNVVIKIYANGSTASPVSTQTITLTSTGFQALPVLRPNVRGAKLYCAEITLVSTGGDAGVEDIELRGESSGITF